MGMRDLETCPQLGVVGLVPLGGAEGPKQTSGGGWMATRDPRGQTSPQVVGLVLRPKGGPKGPTETKGERRTASGRR